MRTVTVPSRSIEACPIRALTPSHYRLDGSCLCGPRIGLERLGRAMVDHGLFWWHTTIIRELERVAECDGPQAGRAAYTVRGLAGNLVRSVAAIRADVDRYVDQLIGAGLLREVEPLWDTGDPPMRFVELVPDVDALEAS